MRRTLFLAWRDPAPDGWEWFPIGRLTFEGGRYEFVYVHGAQTAQRKCAFEPLRAFPSFDIVYESDELFPLFANRVPPPSRPDYGDFIKWLNMPEGSDDPVALLARSGGRRATDSLEVFPRPEADQNGEYHIHFFVHGLSYVPPVSMERLACLQAGERLLLAHDFQNPYDRLALMLRTNDAEPGDGDRHIVGYCPNYLLADCFNILNRCGPDTVTVTIERVNPPPAPLQVRLLCNLTACWPDDFRPFSGEDYQPIVSDVASTSVGTPDA